MSSELCNFIASSTKCSIANLSKKMDDDDISKYSLYAMTFVDSLICAELKTKIQLNELVVDKVHKLNLRIIFNTVYVYAKHYG